MTSGIYSWPTSIYRAPSPIHQWELMYNIGVQLKAPTKKWRKLGQGSYGEVYKIDDKWALKIHHGAYKSTGHSEHCALVKKLHRNDYKCLYKPIDVWKIDDFGFVLMPLYKKLSRYERDTLFDATDSLISVNSYKECFKQLKNHEGLKQFNILGMLHDLEDIGIPFLSNDIHSHNVMKHKDHKDHYILIDLI